VHGNRFITHEVYKRLGPNNLEEVGIELEPIVIRTQELVPLIIDALIDSRDLLYPDSYLANVFKNRTKCAELSKKIEEKLDAV